MEKNEGKVLGWVNADEALGQSFWTVNTEGKGQSGIKRVQILSRRRSNTSSDGESTTSYESLFHDETTLSANEFARTSRNAVGLGSESE